MTDGPARIQLSRTKGWRMPANTIVVARPGLFGNPFSTKTFGFEQAVALHRVWISGLISDAEIEAGYPADQARQLIERRKLVLAKLPDLRGHNLACWCKTPAPYERDRCHAAILLDLANKE